MKPDKTAIAMACFTLAFGLFIVAQLCYGEEPTQIKIIGSDDRLKELKLDAEQIETICIEYQGATRCADTELVYALMSEKFTTVFRNKETPEGFIIEFRMYGRPSKWETLGTIIKDKSEIDRRINKLMELFKTESTEVMVTK
jgi:hypothetical protein